MKTSVLVVAMFVLCWGVLYANTLEATVDTYADWSMLGLPLVPLDPSPADVLSNYDLAFTALLQRWNPMTGSYVSYDPWESPPGAGFGGMLLGDGYWLNNPTADRIIYIGVADGVPDSSGEMTDVCIMLPGSHTDVRDAGGWHLIGYPFSHTTAVNKPGGLDGWNIRFTDGITTKTWGEAAECGWVGDAWSVWDGILQSYETVSYFFAPVETLKAGNGYWVSTNMDNLAVIIPAYTPVP